MIPGEEVNKDVYAVNTGNIGAFVKETVSGILNYTYEKKVAQAPDGSDPDYVELNDGIARAIDGATTNEAGGYLAYFKAADGAAHPEVVLGVINSATITDYNQSQGDTPTDAPGQVEGARWIPPVSGLYIFRRTIDTTASADKKFTYAGYYVVKGAAADGSEDKYYKVVIGDDGFRADEDLLETDGTAKFIFDIGVDQDELGANITVDENTGEISGDVNVQYVKNQKVVNKQVDLTYHAKDETKGVAYLEATYRDGNAGSSVSLAQKEADLAAAEAEKEAAYQAYLNALSAATAGEPAYENALGNYNTAKSRYDQVKADYDYAKELEDATNAIYDAADDRADAEIAMEAAKNAMNEAFNKMINEFGRINADPGSDTDKQKTQFGDLYKASSGLVSDNCDISFKSIFGSTAEDVTSADNDAVAGKLDYIIKNGNWGTTENQHLLDTVITYRTEMYEKWNEIKTQTGKLQTAMKAYETAGLDPERTDGKVDPTEAKKLRDKIIEEQEKLVPMLADYQTLYTNLKEAAATATATSAIPGTLAQDILTNLTTGEAAISGKMDTWKARVAQLKTAINRDTTGDPAEDGLTELIEKYRVAYEAYKAEINNNIPDAERRWAEAVKAYNKKVSDAKDAYEEAIYTNQITKDAAGNYAKNDYEGLVAPSAVTDTTNSHYDVSYNDADGYANDDKDVVRYLTDNSEAIVEVYSSEKPENSNDPKLNVVDADGNLTAPGKALWKEIGADRNATDNSTLDVKGDTTEAVYTPAAALGTQPTYTWISPYTALTEVGSATYTKATNGTAIAAEDDFEEINPTTGTSNAAQKLSTLRDAVTTANSDLTAPTSTYTTTQETLKNAAERLTKAETALNAAQNAVDNNAAAADDSYIKFKIYLEDEDSRLNWTSELMDGETSADKTAAFYYDYILDPGATSYKLIDAVELSNEVKSKDYKDLTFDLDVKLDSAQITYADDQKTVTATAVEANSDTFKLKLGDPITDAQGKLTWGERADNTQYIYFMRNTRVEPTEIAATELPIGAADATTKKTFNYSFTSGGKTYYGESKDGTYYEAGDATPTYVKDTTVEVQAVAPATVTKTTYKLGTTKVKDAEFVALGETITTPGINEDQPVTYAYKITVGGVTYAGENKNNGTTYYKYTAGEAPAVGTIDKDTSLTLTVTTD